MKEEKLAKIKNELTEICDCEDGPGFLLLASYDNALSVTYDGRTVLLLKHAIKADATLRNIVEQVAKTLNTKKTGKEVCHDGVS